MQDARRIAHLSPLTVLPAFVYASPRARLHPPIFYYGWAVDIEDFRALAAARSISRLRLTETCVSAPRPISKAKVDAEFQAMLLDEIGWNEADPAERREMEQESKDYELCSTLAADILEELGIMLPVTYDHVVAVLGEVRGDPETFVRLGFALYNNYHEESRPSEADTEIIKAAFGFRGEPAWFMDAIETSWQDVSNYD